MEFHGGIGYAMIALESAKARRIRQPYHSLLAERVERKPGLIAFE